MVLLIFEHAGPVCYTRSVLSVSTELSVGYRATAWFFTMTALLLIPAALSASLYIFLLAPHLNTPIFHPEHASSLPAALTTLAAYGYALLFLLGKYLQSTSTK